MLGCFMMILVERSNDSSDCMLLCIFGIVDCFILIVTDMCICVIVTMYCSGMGASGTRRASQWAIGSSWSFRVNGGCVVAVCIVIGYDDDGHGVE